jgi:hypothetical protein
MPATTNVHALHLIRSEYLEMPGLTLKPEQVQRLCGVDRAACQIVLDSLVETGFLAARPDGSYARAKNAEVSRLRHAKANLERPLPVTTRLRNSA